MKAIILAAGRGSRMNQFTANSHKCLVKVNGESLINLQLDALYDAGITEIALVTGYQRDLLKNYGDHEFYNSRWQKTNMVTSLSKADKWLKSEPCIVSYSDIFYSSLAIKPLINCSSYIALMYDPNWLSLWKKRFSDPLIDAETFKFDTENKLTEIGNKPLSVSQIQGQYMGLLRFTPEGWNEISRIRKSLSNKDQDSMHMTATLQKVILANRIYISVIPYLGKWGEVDTINDLKLYQ